MNRGDRGGGVESVKSIRHGLDQPAMAARSFPARSRQRSPAPSGVGSVWSLKEIALGEVEPSRRLGSAFNPIGNRGLPLGLFYLGESRAAMRHLLPGRFVPARPREPFRAHRASRRSPTYARGPRMVPPAALHKANLSLTDSLTSVAWLQRRRRSLPKSRADAQRRTLGSVPTNSDSSPARAAFPFFVPRRKCRVSRLVARVYPVTMPLRRAGRTAEHGSRAACNRCTLFRDRRTVTF
jgi:hypothetical protein